VREITLVGQNVNAYHGDDSGGRAATLARLLVRLADIPGLSGCATPQATRATWMTI